MAPFTLADRSDPPIRFFRQTPIFEAASKTQCTSLFLVFWQFPVSREQQGFADPRDLTLTLMDFYWDIWNYCPQVYTDFSAITGVYICWPIYIPLPPIRFGLPKTDGWG